MTFDFERTSKKSTMSKRHFCLSDTCLKIPTYMPDFKTQASSVYFVRLLPIKMALPRAIVMLSLFFTQ